MDTTGDVLKYVIKRTLLQVAIEVPVTCVCGGLSIPFAMAACKAKPAKMIAGMIAAAGSVGIGMAAGIKLGDVILEDANPVKYEEFKKVKKEAYQL